MDESTINNITKNYIPLIANLMTITGLSGAVILGLVKKNKSLTAFMINNFVSREITHLY